MGLKIVSLFIRNFDVKYSQAIQRTPEHYGGAGGELLVLAMIISWCLTLISDQHFVHHNPLKDRVGYNNLCVGWDEPPARYVAAPIFAMVVYFNVRYMYLDVARAKLFNTFYPEGHEFYISRKEINVVWAADSLNCLSFCFSTLIFVVRPMNIHMGPTEDHFDYPLWHTVSFIQLVICQYISYAANMWSTPNSTHKAGCWIFLVIFGVVCTGFATTGLTQMIMYDCEGDCKTAGIKQADGTTPGKRGPVPWWLTACFDYSWFLCMALQGHFRPRAPSVSVKMELSSDEDYTVRTSGSYADPNYPRSDENYTALGKPSQASVQD